MSARSDDEGVSTPICRSATVRATNPTNGERAEPPGKVVTRSTVAAGCRRGPVRADTVRRTFWRRRTGDELGRGKADGDIERCTLVFAAGELAVDSGRILLAGIDGARRADESESWLGPGDEMMWRFGADSDA